MTGRVDAVNEVCRTCYTSDLYAAGWEAGYRRAPLDVRREVHVPPPVYRTTDVRAITRKLEAILAEKVVVE